MKTVRIVLLFIIVAVVLTGGYFGANMYMQNMAIKKINSEIKKNHWENLVEYGDVKANIFSGNITIKDVNFTIQNRMTTQTLGEIRLKKVVLKGDMDKQYKVKGYNIEFISLNPKLPKELENKSLILANSFDFVIRKEHGFVDKIDGGISNITISKTAMDIFRKKDTAKFNEFVKIVKINNPININVSYDASIDKGVLNIKKYSVDFVNNIGVAYKAKIENIDFRGFKEISDELNKNPKNFMVFANLMSKLMQLKIDMFNLSIYNHGLVDRVIDVAAKKKNLNKKAIVSETLQKARMIPIPSAYPAIKNFLTSKSKKLKIEIKNEQKLSIGDLMTKFKNKNNILKILKIKFDN